MVHLKDAITFRRVSKTLPILLANLLQSSKRTFSRGSFLSFLAFKEGMLGTPISVLGGWPTVSRRLLEPSQLTATGSAVTLLEMKVREVGYPISQTHNQCPAGVTPFPVCLPDVGVLI